MVYNKLFQLISTIGTETVVSLTHWVSQPFRLHFITGTTAVEGFTVDPQRQPFKFISRGILLHLDRTSPEESMYSNFVSSNDYLQT